MTITIPKVIGHRGAAGYAPENTLASIRKAAELGARWVEFDVMLSQDEVPILMHDDTLNRTTNDQGPTSKKTLSDLKKLDAGSWFDESFVGEAVPTLKEALALTDLLGIGCNVEVKPMPGNHAQIASAVTEVINGSKTSVAILISSFSGAVIESLYRDLSETPRALLVEKIPDDWLSKLQKWDCVSLNCNHKHLTQEQAKTIKRAGYQLLCYTVNEPKSAASLFGWGVDTIFSDYPDRV